MSPSTRTVYILKEGDELGDYRVVRPLGAGGMGEVYLAEHKHLRKQYAIKILPSDIAEDSTFIERFRVEARVMADLEHPGIVRVHNFGSEKGRYYLVMDYVAGSDGAPRTLDDEIAWGKKLPEKEVRSLGIQMCDALDYAHNFPAGAIVHRDLKPGNILLQKPDSRSSRGTSAIPEESPQPEIRIKIADFGLAKIIGTGYIKDIINRSMNLTMMPEKNPSADQEATYVEQTNASKSGSMLGTYDYMSPEQKTGQEVDGRSDIYAIGLILYRMLTGHKPEGTYEPPSRSGVSKRWDSVIAKCLKRNPDDRYPDVNELRDDLERITAPTYRHPAILYGAPAAAVLLLLGITLLARGCGEKEDKVYPAAPIIATEDKKSENTDKPKPPSPTPDEPAPARTATEETSPPPSEPVQDAVSRDNPEPAPPVIGEVVIPFTVEISPVGTRMTVLRGEELIIDDVEVTESTLPLQLRPGVYSFELKASGFRDYQQNVAVAQDMKKVWKVALERATGFLQYQPGPEQTLNLLDEKGTSVNLERPAEEDGLLIYKLPTGTYEAMITRKGYEPVSRSLDILMDESTALKEQLTPLPGSIRVTCETPASIFRDDVLIGKTGEWIRKQPAGLNHLELRQSGYRNATVVADIPPNQELEVQADPLVEKFATLRVEADYREKDVPEEYQPANARLKVGDLDEIEVSLPWEGEVKQLDQDIEVTLSIDRFDTGNVQTIRLEDYDNETVRFRPKPQPVQLTIESDLPGEVFQLRGKPNSSSWKRMLFGKDKPIGKTGEPLDIEPFKETALTVYREGFKPAQITVKPETAGESMKETITLEKDFDFTPVR